MDTSGFYKLTDSGWIYAPNYVYAKNYTLERTGNRTETDGWSWYDVAPIGKIIAELDQTTQQPVRQFAQTATAERLLAGKIEETKLPEYNSLFDTPIAGKTYVLDWVLLDPITNELYRVVQPSVVWQANWVMTQIPAIVTPFRKPNTITAWKQPAGTHDAYKKGDKVSFNGSNWESTIDGNVWQPGVFGWVKI